MENEFEQKYLHQFNSFFANADLSSTYKPVFLKSIMDLGEFDENPKLLGNQWIEKSAGKLKVELDFVAVRFAKYYWDMYYRFKLRQSHAIMDANIQQFFKERDESKPPTLRELANSDHAQLRKQVIVKSIKPQVLKRLNKDLDLYEIIPQKNYIIFDARIVSFFNKYKGILIPATNYILTRYLEKINFAPRIAEKVLGKIPRDYLGEKEEKILLKIHDSCFYCPKKEDVYHFDHVIPFDYVFHTDIFNMVPACAECNLKKSNRLPERSIFDLVIKRNESLSLPAEYSKEWYTNLYDKCAVEYHGNRDYFVSSK